MSANFSQQLPDTDPAETQEWLDSLDAVVRACGHQRGRYLMRRLLDRAEELGTGISGTVQTPYVNSIPTSEQPFFSGDEHIERRIRAYIRWNAAVMVVKANKQAEGIGGHLSTFASSAALYEVGFNHFFRGKEDGLPGDAVYIQGHAAPGIYARAYLEGRLNEEQLDNFRMEIGGNGLSSYPHPRLMPDFWEYPTVSMGLGPINSIYHARFYRYLHDRRIENTRNSKVWCFVGDGECDEPETLGSVSLAGRAKLNNLIWVVNCNLQRLDGPVRGNGSIIQELEGNFRGSGWNVIKVIWGSRWDELLAADVDSVLLEKMNSTVDGEYQRLATETGAYIRENFFGPDPRLRKLVAHLSDHQLEELPRGGHDYLKLYAAYKAAVETTERPTVILAKTIKGWTLGEGLEARNATHQAKKMTTSQLMELRSRLQLEEEIPAEALSDDANPPYYKPPPNSAEHRYLMARRKELDGPLPMRIINIRRPLKLPNEKLFSNYDKGSEEREVSTTMVFTQMLRNMMRDADFGPRVVPIVPDEARTFGMDSLFREFKIYASQGQLYEPVDHDLLLSYAEGQDGQLLEEGITEAGSMASWTAAATSYATMGVPMVPFYTFYSMFGFQRVGDLIWSAADSRARGFLMGATAGRTTLMGEGLQHQDGHSLLLASTVPACRAYDPAFAYELGAIVRSGLTRMYGNSGGEDEFYYITIYNENYRQPPRASFISDEHILSGLYQWNHAPKDTKQQASIIFSGVSHQTAREAQTELAANYHIGVDLLSAPSYKAAREEALEVERWNRLHPDEEPRVPVVTQRLADANGPVVAVSDYMAMVPDQIARWVPRPFIPLGTDGFGRSDTREALRRFFQTDTNNIIAAVLSALASEGTLDTAVAKDAINRYNLLEPLFDPTS
ncbi:MAG: pyruvate dehydrogenase (acetyl-transferring), homodimeric type [Acidimicrobiia bacterium]|nr:pyruvate dehydrogenase (acetyl-transferring), homodimeric type [Acidimicrobiia bacterium]MYC56967.1 pyruvate dehydrogenase (acetyl-transferring), homodimeric type [Acidimicrobiia bacterium]MYG94101.1 pyruvate dehydrogenase (acetyl-transferring), homodimeric type [Acidimicrobiia bacterium]MYI30832.1 pyruvate dehydrogenase (acetyl-transferring), homodimeric type [Acidimicrobiia bacterium]